MAGDHLAKENFVLEFDARHVEQIRDALIHTQLLRELGRVFVFFYVSIFKTTRKVHRHEPTGDVTRQTERSSDRPEDHLSGSSRTCVENFEPSPDAFAMMPLFGLDLLDVRFLGRVAERFPVTAIREAGG